MNLIRLTPSERLVQVEAFLASDLSNRKIAIQLGVDEGTIRRDRKKLCLSSTERVRLENGEPAEPMLRQRKHLERQRRRVWAKCWESRKEAINRVQYSVLNWPSILSNGSLNKHWSRQMPK